MVVKYCGRHQDVEMQDIMEDKYSDDYAEEEERKLCVADVM